MRIKLKLQSGNSIYYKVVPELDHFFAIDNIVYMSHKDSEEDDYVTNIYVCMCSDSDSAEYTVNSYSNNPDNDSLYDTLHVFYDDVEIDPNMNDLIDFIRTHATEG